MSWRRQKCKNDRRVVIRQKYTCKVCMSTLAFLRFPKSQGKYKHLLLPAFLLPAFLLPAFLLPAFLLPALLLPAFLPQYFAYENAS
jgi:hypothetical protein